MSPSTMRLVAAIVVIVHGLGHALGALPAFGITLTERHAGSSWLLGAVMKEPATLWVGALLWIASLVLLTCSGLAIANWGLSVDLWPRLSLWAATLSLVTILLFFQGLPTMLPNIIGAVLVDIALLYVVLTQQPAGLFSE